MKFANLHLHSTYSDAKFTPRHLVYLGKALGYKALALTDHETDGGCDEFAQIAAQEDVEVLRGAEFYARAGGIGFHLTALDFDPIDPTLRAYIKKRCDLAYEHTKTCFQRGVEQGLIRDFTWQEVLDLTWEGTWFCSATVLNAMRAKKHATAGIHKEVFRSPEALATAPVYPDAEEVIRAVRKAGGIIALAHPGEKGILQVPALVELGLNGIETDHPSIPDERLPLCAEAAERYGLYRLGGTDHTGPMGANGGKYAIPVFNGLTEEEYFTLKERRLG